MSEAILLVLALAGLSMIAYSWRGVRIRQLARARLAAPEPVTEEVAPPPRSNPFLRRQRLLPWLVGGLLAVCLYFLTGLHLTFAVSFGVIVGLLGGQLEAYLAGRKTLLIETQLADAIDLMVAALRAGASVFSALENATVDSRLPLRPQMEEVLGRIRYGDDPQAVLRGLLARVPLESFRLFGAALSVHWEVGGSLAPTLATVGRNIRDRIEVSRRVRSLTTQSRSSIVAVLLVTYFIAFVMWRTDPPRMAEFLATGLGRGLVAAVVLLQAVGIAWSATISRLRF